MKLIINISDESYDKALNGIINCKECFDAIVYGTPIPDNATNGDVLDKIKAEIKELSYPYNLDAMRTKSDVLQIIDKYTKGEFEQKNKGNKFFSKYLSDYLDRIEKENERLDEILSDEIEKLANK